MHHHSSCHPSYTAPVAGFRGFGPELHGPMSHAHGFCVSCCHPVAKCCCGERECRKEAKELIAAPDLTDQGTTPSYTTTAEKRAFIGGGCCVHLSVEFMPLAVKRSVDSTSSIRVLVEDSEKTALQWSRIVEPGDAYQIKEGIITTNPGAILTLTVDSAVARVRWCEVFSC